MTAAAVAVALAAGPAAANVESEVNDLWRGAWVIVQIGATSKCDGSYTDNAVRGRRAVGKGDHLFDPGELAIVHKVRVKRKQAEVLLDLAESILAPRRDGPFTLYDERACKIELELPVAGGRKAGAGEIDRAIAAVLERHDGSQAARRSAAWNRRLRKPYPADYERTLVEYEAWKATQVNVEVQAKIERSIEEAARIVDRLDDDPEFVSGFLAGVEEARREFFGHDCERLLERSFYSFRERAPKEAAKQWKEGFEEGQKLVFHLEIGRRLNRCFVPIPPLPF